MAAISPQWEAAGLRAVNLGAFVQLLQFQLDLARETVHSDETNEGLELLDVVYETRHRQVTDPRDRYFALQGVTSTNAVPLLDPDYTLRVDEIHSRLQSLIRSAPLKPDDDVSLPERSSAAGQGVTVDIADVENNVSAECPGRPINTYLAGMQQLSPSDRHSILRNHLQAACSQATTYLQQGNFGRAATLLKMLALEIEGCAESNREDAAAGPLGGTVGCATAGEEGPICG